MSKWFIYKDAAPVNSRHCMTIRKEFNSEQYCIYFTLSDSSIQAWGFGIDKQERDEVFLNLIKTL